MEGLEATELKLSEVHAENVSFRFDPEFFNKVALQAVYALKGNRKLSETVKSGYRVVYENTHIVERLSGISLGLPFFLQAADITTPFIQPEEMNCVAEGDWVRYTKGHIIPGEVLIEVKGRAEKVAIVPDDFPRKTLVTGTCYKLSVRDPLDKHLLVTFLTCRYGQALKDRLKTNLLVSFLAKDDLYSLPVPETSDELKREISRVFVAAEGLHKQSKRLYTHAETLLLRELGLDNVNLSDELVYQRSFKDIEQAARFDAECFQPKYYRLLDAIEKCGLPNQPLIDLIEPIRNGFDYRDFTEAGTAYIRVGDVKQGRIDIAGAAKINFNSEDLTKDVGLEVGDVLFTRKGSYGNAAVVRDGQEQAIISSEIMLLRLTDEHVLPDYLALFMNSLVGKQQVERWAHGAAFYSISQSDLAQVKVVVPIRGVQEQLTALVQRSLYTEQEAKQLLETAKRAVEVAIEDSEEAALALLKNTDAAIKEVE